MLSVIESLSWPGSEKRSNEDACGACGRYAWVIDGTIMTGYPPLLHERSDATWLASFISARFAYHAQTAEDGPTLVRRAIEDARAAFLAAMPPEREDPLSWPVAALSLLQVRERTLEVWTLADTAAYVLDADGAFHAAGEPAELRQTESALAAQMLRESGLSPEAVWEHAAFRTWLTDQRRRANTDAGVPLLGIVPSAAERMHHQVIRPEGRTLALLATDGFSALAELYGAVSPCGLVQEAARSGLETLARRLRDIEHSDPKAERFPRFKVSDDATAILVRIG